MIIDVTRIQYPVGQGCFHVGSVEWGSVPGSGSYRYVYDCGSKNKTALTHSVNAMLNRHPGIDALFISHLHDDHVNGLDQLLSSVRANTVFIPHLSVGAIVADLVAGAADGALSHSLIEASLDPQGWFGQRGVSRIVRVRPSPPGEPLAAGTGSEDSPEGGEPRYADISWKPRETRDEKGATPADLESMESGQMLAPDPGTRTLDWVLVPHVDPELQVNVTRFETEIANVLGLLDLYDLTTQQLSDALQVAEQRKKLRDCYTGCFGANHNRVSMSVYSGPKSDPEGQHWSYFPEYWFRDLFHWRGAAGWIGTGDAELKDDQVRNAWQRSYDFFLPNLSTLLLPHHGSNRNFSSELLKYPRLANCIVSAGDPSQYSHPGIEVIESVKHALKHFHHVSEKPGTLCFERFKG